MFRKTPLAWLQLIKDKTRLIVALAGIAFADMLMFTQLGLLDALFDGITAPQQHFQADLILVNPKFQTLFYIKHFSREHLYQSLGYEGVESVHSLYVEQAQWRNPETFFTNGLLVWGVDPSKPGFNILEIKQNQHQLKNLDRALFDRASRFEFGPIPELLKKTKPLSVQVNDQQIQIVGLFTLGASFGTGGNVVTSDSNFLRLFPNHPPNQVSVGLINLKPGADIKKVKAQLIAGLPPNLVRVLTPQEFAQVEINYWSNQGIGFVFLLGTAVGFIVGIVIVYQILYSDVSDHLLEYATLKAMGYPDSYFLGVLLQAAIIMAVLGYIPGFFISVGLYQVAHSATLLPIGMKLGRAVAVLLLTMIMCIASGFIAMRKLRSADPADIFR